MPIVTLENAGNLDQNQKNDLIKKLTEVVVEVTGKPASSVYTKLIEIPRESFGVGGRPLN